jgi:hypothetical protein
MTLQSIGHKRKSARIFFMWRKIGATIFVDFRLVVMLKLTYMFLFRVTKFKINWETMNGENAENVPPKFNPNQVP